MRPPKENQLSDIRDFAQIPYKFYIDLKSANSLGVIHKERPIEKVGG